MTFSIPLLPFSFVISESFFHSADETSSSCSEISCPWSKKNTYLKSWWTWASSCFLGFSGIGCVSISIGSNWFLKCQSVRRICEIPVSSRTSLFAVSKSSLSQFSQCPPGASRLFKFTWWIIKNSSHLRTYALAVKCPLKFFLVQRFSEFWSCFFKWANLCSSSGKSFKYCSIWAIVFRCCSLYYIILRSLKL